jgi:hypothetical protein
MTWLTWRQLRTQAVTVYAAVGALAIVLLVTGVRLADLSETSGSAFLARLGSGSEATIYVAGSLAVLVLPAIIGVFWGAPLVAREVEAGTHRLAWNQTVTRTRWLVTKVAVTGGLAILAAAVLSLLLTWWSGPIDDAIQGGRQQVEGVFRPSRVTPWIFDARGIAPIGYTAFAFALGVTSGILLRRTVPAMAATLALFVVVQVAMPALVRGRVAPQEVTTPITAENLRGILVGGPEPGSHVEEVHIDLGRSAAGAWIVREETLDASGAAVDRLPAWAVDCAAPPGEGGPGQAACFRRLAREGYRQHVTFHPASRYWTLQAVETAIFAALALALLACGSWWLRRRMS